MQLSSRRAHTTTGRLQASRHPSLGPTEGVALAGRVVAGSGLHAARVTPMVGLCELEAAQEFPFGQPGQVLLPPPLTAICIHGVCDKGKLDTHP